MDLSRELQSSRPSIETLVNEERYPTQPITREGTFYKVFGVAKNVSNDDLRVSCRSAYGKLHSLQDHLSAYMASPPTNAPFNVQVVDFNFPIFSHEVPPQIKEYLSTMRTLISTAESQLLNGENRAAYDKKMEEGEGRVDIPFVDHYENLSIRSKPLDRFASNQEDINESWLKYNIARKETLSCASLLSREAQALMNNAEFAYYILSHPERRNEYNQEYDAYYSSPKKPIKWYSQSSKEVAGENTLSEDKKRKFSV